MFFFDKLDIRNDFKTKDTDELVHNFTYVRDKLIHLFLVNIWHRTKNELKYILRRHEKKMLFFRSKSVKYSTSRNEMRLNAFMKILVLSKGKVKAFKLKLYCQHAQFNANYADFTVSRYVYQRHLNIKYFQPIFFWLKLIYKMAT